MQLMLLEVLLLYAAEQQHLCWLQQHSQHLPSAWLKFELFCISENARLDLLVGIG